jgi:hypothetical protein
MFEGLKIDQKKNVETAILIAIALLIMAWKYQDERFIIGCIGILILSLILPIVFYPIAKLWFGLGLLLGFVTTKVLLTIIFFLMVTPVGLFRKLLGRDTLSLKKFKKGTASVMAIRNHKFIPEDLKNPF